MLNVNTDLCVENDKFQHDHPVQIKLAFSDRQPIGTLHARLNSVQRWRTEDSLLDYKSGATMSPANWMLLNRFRVNEFLILLAFFPSE